MPDDDPAPTLKTGSIITAASSTYNSQGSTKNAGVMRRRHFVPRLWPSSDREWLPSNRQLRARPARALLAEPGCPACGAQYEADEAFFAWFVAESYAEVNTILHLRGSGGFCPRHARQFLTTTGQSRVPTTVYEDLVRTSFDDRAPELPARSRDCLPCIANENAQRAVISSLIEQLRDQRFVNLYRSHGGLCCTHSEVAVADAHNSGVALALLNAASRRLDTARDPTQLRCALGPLDGDAPLRDRLRNAIDRDDLSGHELLRSRAGRAALHYGCLVCRRTAVAEKAVLEAIAAGLEPRAGAEQRSPHRCLRHHDDLTIRNPELETAELESLTIAQHATIGATSLRKTRGRRPGTRRATRERTASRLTNDDRCVCCSVAAQSELDQLALVEDALRESAIADLYEQGDGLCLHHVRCLAVPRPPVALRVAAARLSGIEVDLEEQLRKRRWDARHETPGAEQGATLRAASALDGRVFSGLTAGIAAAQLGLPYSC